MKKISILLLFLAAFNQAFAQETVALAPRKLQQLYLSVGAGPALTINKNIKPVGSQLAVDLNGAFGRSLVIKTGFKGAGFTFADASPVAGEILFVQGSHQVHSFYVAAGKGKMLSDLVKVQALGGVSYNLYWKPNHPTLKDYEGLPEINSRMQPNRIGAIIQGEAMFLPSCFAGLTLGTYYHYVPEISNGGLTLSLNLGLLRR